MTAFHQQSIQNPQAENGQVKGQNERIVESDFNPKLTDADLTLIKNYESRMQELLKDEPYTHIGLNYTVGKYYTEMVNRFCEQLLDEFDCKTHSEIALVEIAASSFVKYLDYSELLQELSHKPFNNLTNSSFSALSKEVERAHRAYISAILTLRQLKSPPLEVKIKTTNAFIANNQQINSEKTNP